MTNKEIIERARVESTFRTTLLKEMLRIAVTEDPDLLTKALLKMDIK
jgi:hypothetical protein